MINTWAYIVLGCMAPMLPFFFMSISSDHSADHYPLPLLETALNVGRTALIFLIPIAAFAAVLIAATRLRIWWESRRIREDRGA